MLLTLSLFCLASISFGHHGTGGDVGHDVRADIADYPYQLSLEVNGVHTCGASIISTDWAVTSAQCAQEAVTVMTLRAGTSTLHSGGTVHQVAQKIVHSDFSPITLDYDMALLRVLTPFDAGVGVAAVKLPDQSQITAQYTMSVITGWKITSTVTDNLTAVAIPITSDEHCKLVYSDAQITERMICTDVTEGRVCQGESGNPVVVHDVNDDPQLVGVVSWGQGCLPYYPIVNAKVSEMREWIHYNCGV